MKTRDIRILVVVLAVLVVVGGGAVAYAVVRLPGGAPTPAAAVDGYLAALADRDRAKLMKLADPHNDSAAEIDRRLRLYGGGQFVTTERQIGDSTNDNIKGATLTGQLNGALFIDQIFLTRHRDHWRYRWFLDLGPERT